MVAMAVTVTVAGAGAGAWTVRGAKASVIKLALQRLGLPELLG